MEFLNLTEEQKALLDSTNRYIERRVKPMRKEIDNRPVPKAMAHEVMGELAELGFIGGTLPVEMGGGGLSYLTEGLLYEQLAKAFAGLAGIAFITSSTAKAVALEGSDQHRAAYLKGLLKGELIGCVAITEPDVGSNPSDVKTTATRDGDDWIISGEKSWISNGDISDICIVVARRSGGEGLSRFITERADGYTTRDIEKMAMNEWPTSIIHFDQIAVPDWRRLGGEGTGLKATLKGFEVARAYVALLALGIAEAALEGAIEYAKVRRQWGKPIGQHQLVQQMLADMAIMTDAARLLTLRGLALIDQGVRCDTQTSMAKAYTTEAAVKVASLGVQIHGAYGISKEYPAERLFREARVLPIPDGTTQIQKLIIGRNLTGFRAF
ncbi:MAG: acyl-CoA dehydrogenase family protein [Candidatus Binataceae bacterium]|jgi:alkylation response protein AidB-like acyl-CoA dehydrogenase